MNSVAGTCSWRRAAMTFSLYQDATFLLRSSFSMPGVMSASNVSATIFLSVAAWSKLSGFSAETASAVETASTAQSAPYSHSQRTGKTAFLFTHNAVLESPRCAAGRVYLGNALLRQRVLRYADARIMAAKRCEGDLP